MAEMDRRAARGQCAMLVCDVAKGAHMIADRSTWRYCGNVTCEWDDMLCLGHYHLWRGPDRWQNGPPF